MQLREAWPSTKSGAAIAKMQYYIIKSRLSFRMRCVGHLLAEREKEGAVSNKFDSSLSTASCVVFLTISITQKHISHMTDCWTNIHYIPMPFYISQLIIHPSLIHSNEITTFRETMKI